MDNNVTVHNAAATITMRLIFAPSKSPSTPQHRVIPAAVVELGSTTSFAILTGCLVSSCGAFVLNGDLGLFSGEVMAGFVPTTVSKAQYLNARLSGRTK